MRKMRIWGAILLLCGYLGIYNGHLAIWYQDDPEPTAIFPYRETHYPDADRAALKKRIPFSDQKELTTLLEDYLS